MDSGNQMGRVVRHRDMGRTSSDHVTPTASLWFTCEAERGARSFSDDLDEAAQRVDDWFASFDEVWSAGPEVVAHPTVLDAFTTADWWWVAALGNVLDVRAIHDEDSSDQHEITATFIGRSPEFGTVAPEFALDLIVRHAADLGGLGDPRRHDAIRFVCSLSRDVAAGLSAMLARVGRLEHEDLRRLADDLGATLWPSEIGAMVAALAPALRDETVDDPMATQVTGRLSRMIHDLAGCVSNEVRLGVALTVHPAASGTRDVVDAVAALVGND